MKTVMFDSLPQSTEEELDRFAKETGSNKSDIVKQSISLYLWEACFMQIKSGLRDTASSVLIRVERVFSFACFKT